MSQSSKTEVSGVVGEWLDSVASPPKSDPEVESVWGESEFGFGGSVAGDYDTVGFHSKVMEDEVSPVEPDEATVETVGRVLGELAGRQQRLESASFRRMYVRGRAHVDHGWGEVEMVRHPLFMVSAYEQLTDLNDDAFYERLRRGRLVTRVSAPTASGKTRRFPGLIATKCSKRVCLVVLDAVLAAEALDAGRAEFGISGSSRVWSRKPGPYLGVISYHDFFGICKSNGRKRFFQDFDVFVFDEPHVKTGCVYNAKMCFAAYSGGTSSLLLLSATVSTNPENDLAAKNLGTFDVEPVPGGFSGLLASGKLLTQYLVDRTMVILSHAFKVYEAEAYYHEAGCDVRVLDQGSSRRDKENIFGWLAQGSAAVPRVLVAIREFGTSHNFPVSYVISDCEALIHEVQPDGSLVDRYVPLEETEVKQHSGRTGRQLAPGSGGILCSKNRAMIEGDLPKCERIDAYLRLLACGIKPRMGFLGDYESLIPIELNSRVAAYILSFSLPPLLVMRYLGSDGLVARRFTGALKLFMQRDHSVDASVDVDPVGYTGWVEEPLGGYYPAVEVDARVTVMVPFPSTPTLRVVMHTIFAVSRGWLDVGLWHPSIADASCSDDEDLGMRGQLKAKVQPVKLRLVTDEAPPPPPEESKPGWAYRADAAKLGQARRRQAISWVDGSVGQKVVSEMVRRAEKGEGFDAVRVDVQHVEENGLSAVQLRRPLSIEIESPGGTPVFKLPQNLYEILVKGEKLSPGMLVTLMTVAKQMKTAFVVSTLFDMWGPPWVSVLSSCGDYSAMSYAVAHGFGVTAKMVVERLYDRFRSETVKVCTESKLYRAAVKSLWSRGISVTKLARAIDRGRLPVAQSDQFLRQFSRIHGLYGTAVNCMESCGVFNPGLVSQMQEPLPLRGKVVRMPVVGEGEVVENVAYRDKF